MLCAKDADAHLRCVVSTVAIADDHVLFRSCCSDADSASFKEIHPSPLIHHLPPGLPIPQLSQAQQAIPVIGNQAAVIECGQVQEVDEARFDLMEKVLVQYWAPVEEASSSTLPDPSM